jgi:catechol 2,3-dioxygenase-like lactoylglutathione lyase family enzyme
MIAHIIINIRDFKESEIFYDSILYRIGFTSDYIEDDEKGSIKSYRKQTHNFWIKYNSESEHHEFVRDVGLDHIAFSVESKIEIDEIYNLVRTLNVKITREPREYPEYSDNYYAFYLRDPNGIPIEICYM